RANSKLTRPLQVISGTIVDYDTGLPVPNRNVQLLDEDRDEIGRVVSSDANGDFVIRTLRAGPLRIRANGDAAYHVATSPVIDVSNNELVIVKLFISSQ